MITSFSPANFQALPRTVFWYYFMKTTCFLSLWDLSISFACNNFVIATPTVCYPWLSITRSMPRYWNLAMTPGHGPFTLPSQKVHQSTSRLCRGAGVGSVMCTHVKRKTEAMVQVCYRYRQISTWDKCVTDVERLYTVNNSHRIIYTAHYLLNRGMGNLHFYTTGSF